MIGLRHRVLSNMEEASRQSENRFTALNSKIKSFKDHQGKTNNEFNRVIHWLKEYTALRNEQVLIEKGICSLLESFETEIAKNGNSGGQIINNQPGCQYDDDGFDNNDNKKKKYDMNTEQHEGISDKSDHGIDSFSLLSNIRHINTVVRDEKLHYTSLMDGLRSIMEDFAKYKTIADDKCTDKANNINELAEFFLSQKGLLLDIESDLEFSEYDLSLALRSFKENVLSFHERSEREDKDKDLSLQHTILPVELQEKLSIAKAQLECFKGYNENENEFDVLYQDIFREYVDIEDNYELTVKHAKDYFKDISSNAFEPNGGWSKDEYFALKNALSLPGDKLLDASSPIMAPDSRASFKTWYHQNKMYQQKIKAAKHTRSSKRCSLTFSSTKKVESFVLSVSSNAVNETSRSINQHQRNELRAHLSAIREARTEKNILTKAERDRFEARELKSKRIAKDRKNMRMQHLRRTLERHDKDVQLKRLESEKVASRRKAVEAKEKEVRMKYNGKRTIHRRQLLDLKQREQHEASAIYAESETKRIMKLNQLASSVPYYDTIINLKPVFRSKSTVARENDQYVLDESGLKSFQHGAHGKATSFSDERVFSSKLFRLSNALHEAGLAKSNYARDVVKKLVPREPARTTGIMPS